MPIGSLNEQGLLSHMTQGARNQSLETDLDAFGRLAPHMTLMQSLPAAYPRRDQMQTFPSGARRTRLEREVFTGPSGAIRTSSSAGTAATFGQMGLVVPLLVMWPQLSLQAELPTIPSTGSTVIAAAVERF